MPVSPSEHVSAVASDPTRQRTGRLAVVLAVCAVLATVGWGFLVVAAAQQIRPQELQHVSQYSDAELQAIIGPARAHMWIVLFASFAVVAALATLAILLGRRALRGMTDENAFARVGKWATRCLISGLALGSVIILLAQIERFLPSAFLSRLDSIYALFYVGGFLIVLLPMAGAVGSIIAGSVALRRRAPEPAQAGGRPLRWRRGVVVCLIAAPVVVLAGFLVIAGVAQFSIGFYLRLVF